MKYVQKQRSIIMIMLFICGVINYLDRSALSISAGYITKDFGLTPSQLGIVFSAFSVGYALFNVVGGMAADKFGPKDTLLVAVIVWSLFSGALIFAIGLTSILVIRVIFGMAEGPLSTTINKTIDMWYPADRKTSMVGLANSGTPLGAAISGPIVGFIALNYGWRMSFIVITLIGLIWAVIWFKLVDKKPKEKTEAAKTTSTAGKEKIQVPMKLSFYLKNKTIIFSALGFFAYNYILFFFLTWFPSYLKTEQNLPLEKVSLISMIPWTFGFVALASGGAVSDKINKIFAHKNDELFSKRFILSVGLSVSGIAVFIAGNIHNLSLSIALIAMSVFFLYFTGSIYWGIVNTIVDSESVGSVGGIMHGVGNCAGILGPIVTGFVVQYTNSFIPAFMIAGCLGILGAIGAFCFIRKVEVTNQLIEKYKKRR